MKVKNLLAVSMLVVVMGLIGGCYYGVPDGYRDYSDDGSYRDGFRDGRGFERRRDDWRDRRYRGDYRTGRG